MEELNQPVMVSNCIQGLLFLLDGQDLDSDLSLCACGWHTSLDLQGCSCPSHDKINRSLLPSSGERERHFLRRHLTNSRPGRFCFTEVFHKKLISISHDDVTNIQLCIYRDTPKSACLSAVPSHSQVPHPLCMCVCMCYRKRCHLSYLQGPVHRILDEYSPAFQILQS